MRYRIAIQAKTPLAFRSEINSLRGETLNYVPGTSLLGGLAQVHKALDRTPEEFTAFFVHGRIRFSNCYPASFTIPALQNDYDAVLPMPVTARSCKRFSGFAFHAEEDGEPRAGVRDLLIPLALFAMSDEQKSDILDPYQYHPCTYQPLDRLSGFFRRGQEASHYGQPAVHTALRTRTGINHMTGTAQSAILYNRQVIERDTQFWGMWEVDDHLADMFDACMTKIDESHLLRIGSNRTRGFGSIHIHTARQKQDTLEDLRARVEEFTQRLKRQAKQVGVAAPAALYVPVLLTSDAILTDKLLRSRLLVLPEDLEAVGIDDAELVFHMGGMRQIKGWNSLWGLPKADEWSITMGSVFLFALPNTSDATFKALHLLQHQGIGLRRTEGFGNIAVAHPFHNELAEEYR
ncbi:MAG: hypothetical protein HC828_03085 [Blastochloris sp.]|nr:hypothetical protein [Blastochloris sp.]